jgi:hypothetical protein
MGYKHDDLNQSLEQLKVPETIDIFIKDLPNRYINGELSKETEEQVDKDWLAFRNRSKRGINKKIIAFPLTFAAACLLFVGSAFVSPAMAQLASKIPYLNLIFEEKLDVKPLNTEISQAIYESGLGSGNIVVTVSKKEKLITTMVIDTEEYFNQIKTPLEDLIHDILRARNEEGFYELKLLNDPEMARLFAEDMHSEEEDAEIDKIYGFIGEVLQKFGYDTGGVGVRKGRIDLNNIPNTETRVDEIKAEIIEKLKQENMGEFVVKVYLFDPEKREREGKFLPLFDTIAIGLKAKSEFKVDGVGYSNKSKERFYIEVQTILSVSDSDREAVVNNIKQTVEDFLQSAEAQEKIKDYKYEVVILSKDDKQLDVIRN